MTVPRRAPFSGRERQVRDGPALPSLHVLCYGGAAAFTLAVGWRICFKFVARKTASSPAQSPATAERLRRDEVLPPSDAFQ